MVATIHRIASLRALIARRLSCLSSSAIATWLTALAFIAILLTGWVHTKTTVENQLQHQVLTVARFAAEQTAIAFDSVGTTLQTIGDGLQADDLTSFNRLAPDRRLALQTTLIRARGRNPGLVSLVITDPTGRVLAGSPFHADGSTSAGRRADVSLLSQDDRHDPAVSAPFRDPASGMWLVRIALRIGNPEGMMAGMLIANVAIDDALANFFNRHPLAEGDTIALYDASDRPLTVVPNNNSAGRTDQADRVVAGALDAERIEDVRYLTSPNNGSVRLVASRRLAGYPFYIVYGKNVDAWLVKWRQEQFVLALAVFAALIVTAAITTGIQRRLTLTGQLEKVRGDLENSNTALRSTLATAELLAARDQLTGLCNRRNFDQRLEGAIARSARHGDRFSLLMIDIDHFKNINDHYGHATGDDVLRRFGEVLSERLRQNDIAARWGGEEFAVLADGTSLENARLLAEQIRESVAMTPFPPVPRVTVSVGVAEYQEGESGDDLLRHADKALYGAKRNGRNRVIATESNQTLKLQSA